jgi:hypothetical protein
MFAWLRQCVTVGLTAYVSCTRTIQAKKSAVQKKRRRKNQQLEKTKQWRLQLKQNSTQRTEGTRGHMVR